LDRSHNEPLVIILTIWDFNVERVLVDIGSTLDVIFHATLREMKVDIAQIVPTPRSALGFSRETTMTLGTIKLPVRAKSVMKVVDFSITDLPTVYNAIIGIPLLNQFRAVASTYNLCLKFPKSKSVKTIWGNKKMPEFSSLQHTNSETPSPNQQPTQITKRLSWVEPKKKQSPSSYSS